MVVIHAAYTAVNLLAGTFLSIFLWRTSHALTLIAAFNGTLLLMIPFAFVANGLGLRRAGAGTAIRLGLSGIGASYLAVLLLGPRSVGWVIPLGMLRGLGEGWYWAGYHLTTYDSTCARDRDRYFGAMGACSWLLTAVLPPLAGLIIVAGDRWGGAPYRGYQVVFGLATVLLAGATVAAGGLHCGRRTGFSLREALWVGQRNRGWHWVSLARLIDGFTGSLGGLVLTVLTYLVLNNEQQVGAFNGLVGLVGVALSLALGAWMRPRFRVPCALLGASLLVLSTMVLPLYLSAAALLVYGLLRAVGGPLHGNALAPVALQVIDRDAQAGRLRYEYIVHQELCLWVGRMLSIGCFLLLATPSDQVLVARLVVVITGAAPILILAVLARAIARPADADERVLPAAA